MLLRKKGSLFCILLFLRNLNFSIDSLVVETWVNYFDNCLSVDFLKNNVIRAEGIANIFVFIFDETFSKFTSVEIVPVDRNLFTDRNLKNTRLFYFGPNIVMSKEAPYRSSDDYILELKQDIFVEDDPSKNCVNFPTREFQSYNDCDKNFTITKLAEHYGPDLVPIWATLDLKTVTKKHFVDWSYDFGPLYDGTTKSDCPLPCKTTSVNARFISRKQVDQF